MFPEPRSACAAFHMFAHRQPIFQKVPSRALQMIHREYHNVYSEVDALSTLLGYKTSNAGCCKARQPIDRIFLGGRLLLSWVAHRQLPGCSHIRH